jgi:hypothetical protein
MEASYHVFRVQGARPRSPICIAKRSDQSQFTSSDTHATPDKIHHTHYYIREAQIRPTELRTRLSFTLSIHKPFLLIGLHGTHSRAATSISREDRAASNPSSIFRGTKIRHERPYHFYCEWKQCKVPIARTRTQPDPCRERWHMQEQARQLARHPSDGGGGQLVSGYTRWCGLECWSMSGLCAVAAWGPGPRVQEARRAAARDIIE